MAYPEATWERAMTVQEVILKALSGELHWFRAADILGVVAADAAPVPVDIISQDEDDANVSRRRRGARVCRFGIVPGVRPAASTCTDPGKISEVAKHELASVCAGVGILLTM